MSWRLTDDGWDLVGRDEGREVILDHMTYDRDQYQYRDNRGVQVGAKWESAKRKCEERARQFAASCIE